ncbi:MAG: sugar transferase [Cytophagales bacterium]|nr:sugar transferase [Cytophagales bacterium]
MYIRYLKRLGDLFFSLFFFVFFVGVFLVLILFFLVTLNLPIFYVSKRIGKTGKVFEMYKFRTLSTDLNLDLIERQFPLGRFLRFTNLDELPQLWNVLKGEMSLVGPRPLPVEYANLFSGEQNNRHKILPGITGLAQVNGKNDLSWNEKFKLDLEYVNKVSFSLDIQILFKTLILALSFKKDTSLAEKKFAG